MPKVMSIPSKVNNDSLADKTLMYWNISSCYRDKPSRIKMITTENGFRLFNDALKRLDPSRPLAFHLRTLRDEIVQGSGRSHAEDVAAHNLPA